LGQALTRFATRSRGVISLLLSNPAGNFNRPLASTARKVPFIRAVSSGPDLLRRGRGTRGSGLRLRGLCVGRCYRAHFFPTCLFKTTLQFHGSVLCCRAFFSCSSVQQRAVTNEGLKFGRELLYSPLSFSFRFLRVYSRLA